MESKPNFSELESAPVVYQLKGLWCGLTWGCALAGRPSVQIALADQADLSDDVVRPVEWGFNQLINYIREPLHQLKIVQLHAADFDSEGRIVRFGDVLSQEKIFPLIARFLEQIENQVVLNVNNQTDISMVDPRANIVLVPATPSTGRESKNFWGNLEYLSEDGEILFRIKNENDFHWMVDCTRNYALTERFTVHMTPIDKNEAYQKWAKKLIQQSLGIHLLPWIPFTPVPLRGQTRKYPKT